MSTAHCCALPCAHCRLLPPVSTILYLGPTTIVNCTSDRPIKPSDHHTGEPSEEKSFGNTTRSTHVTPLVHSVHQLHVSTRKLRGVSIGPPLRRPPKTIVHTEIAVLSRTSVVAESDSIVFGGTSIHKPSSSSLYVLDRLLKK